MQQGPELCYKAGRSENWQTVDNVTISSLGQKRDSQTLNRDVIAELGFTEMKRVS